MFAHFASLISLTLRLAATSVGVRHIPTTSAHDGVINLDNLSVKNQIVPLVVFQTSHHSTIGTQCGLATTLSLSRRTRVLKPPQMYLQNGGKLLLVRYFLHGIHGIH